MKQFLTIFLMLLCIGTYAQQKKVAGTVTDDKKEPVPGVTVRSSTETVGTDKNGKFNISAQTGETLTFTYMGMKTITVTVPASNEPLLIVLEYATGSLNEVVVTGYQTQKKADLTGAVSVLKVSDIKDIPVGNPLKAIQGRIPGVNITTDGTPNGGATVRIRGIGTLGNNDPLYIIDGIPTKRGLEQINPNDIESFQVLKDAGSASIYGSRAANGVIIITTKRGKSGRTQFDVSSSVSIQDYHTKLPVLNSEERGRLFFLAAVNDGVADPNTVSGIYKFDFSTVNGKPVLNKVIIPEFIDAGKTMRAANTDWYDEVSQSAIIQNYDLTVSSGGEKSNTLFGLSYYDNRGVVKNTYSKRIAGRLNSEYKLFDNKLKLGENLGLNLITRDRLPTTGGDGILFNSYQVQPLVPVHTVDGGWGGPAAGMTDKQNPVRQIEDNKQNKNYYARVLGNVYADLEPISNLHIRSSFGIDYTTSYQRTLRKSYKSGSLSNPINQVANSQIYDGSLTWQNTINYKITKGKSVIDLLGGHEQIIYNTQDFSASREGLALENIDYAYLNAGTSNIQNSGSGTIYTLQSFFAKVNYVYDNKYLLSGTIRRDGSSRFGKKNQYGTFPAFSAGWRISQEEFLKNNSLLSDLKLRFSYGKTGNQEIANNAAYTIYQSVFGTDRTFDPDRGTAYDINGTNGGAIPSGYVRTQIGNDALKWESTEELNFGMDFGLFSNALTGSVDYFIKKTSGILVVPPLLAVNGGGTPPWVNGASMQNKGVEILLSYNGKVNDDLTFSITGNIATYRNKVTDLPVNSLSAYPGNGTTATILGRSINSTFGYVADGLFTSEDEVANSPAQPGKGLGRIRFKDLNGDNVINDLDRTYIRKGDPDFTYGLNLSANYKRFDASVFFQGVQGIEVSNSFKSLADFTSLSGGSNWGRRTLDAWTPENNTSTIPALSLVDRNSEGRSSTYFIEPGSYLKLRNIQIGYTFDKAIGYLKSFRVFAQGSNVFTIKSKNFTGPDPEMSGFSFPIPSIYTFGVNVSL